MTTDIERIAIRILGHVPQDLTVESLIEKLVAKHKSATRFAYIRGAWHSEYWGYKRLLGAVEWMRDYSLTTPHPYPSEEKEEETK